MVLRTVWFDEVSSSKTHERWAVSRSKLNDPKDKLLLLPEEKYCSVDLAF